MNFYRRLHRPRRADSSRAPRCSRRCSPPIRRPGTRRMPSSRSKRSATPSPTRSSSACNGPSSRRSIARTSTCSPARSTTSSTPSTQPPPSSASTVSTTSREARAMAGIIKSGSRPCRSRWRCEPSSSGAASPERAVELNRLENAADHVHDDALRRLFERGDGRHSHHQVARSYSTCSSKPPTVRGRRQRPRRASWSSTPGKRWT